MGGYFLVKFFLYMKFINLWWGIINLLPVYPLDGGQICMEIMEGTKGIAGRAKTYKISMITAIIVAIFLLFREETFAVFLFIYMAYENYRLMTHRAY